MQDLTIPDALRTSDILNSESYAQENEALRLLAKATDLLAMGTDYEATLNCIAGLLVSSLASWCTIDLVNDDGQIERVSVAHRDPTKADLTQEVLLKYPARPTAKRGVHRVVETGKSILISHTPESLWAQRAENAEHLRMILELGSTSYMCVPLNARGRVVGVIMLLSSERTYNEADLQTAERLASCIAMAVENVSMYRKLKSAQDQVVHSAKLAALGTISAGIAHEINNPLTIIKGQMICFERFLQKNPDLQAEYLMAGMPRINGSIDRIANIVRSIKDFSRFSSRQHTVVDLSQVIDSSLALFEEQFQLNEITVHRFFSKNTVLVLGDFLRLEQVLVNVLSNAQDAIKAKPHGEGGLIQILLESSGGKVKIAVVDDGIGLDLQKKDRVFEPFFTTKGVGDGTGLGLSISHGIIKDHGGVIKFSAEEKRGAKITIELPEHTPLA